MVEKGAASVCVYSANPYSSAFSLGPVQTLAYGEWRSWPGTGAQHTDADAFEGVSWGSTRDNTGNPGNIGASTFGSGSTGRASTTGSGSTGPASTTGSSGLESKGTVGREGPHEGREHRMGDGHVGAVEKVPDEQLEYGATYPGAGTGTGKEASEIRHPLFADVTVTDAVDELDHYHRMVLTQSSPY